MQDIIDSVKIYNYGFCETINKSNVFIKKAHSVYYDCSIPDEIFDTENYTLIDKILNIPEPCPSCPLVSIRKRRFTVNDKDSLFWTFYILLNGLEMYSEIGVKNLICEKKEKLYIVDNVVQKNTQLLKNYKIRITKNIIQNLAYDKNISFQTFQVLCILHNMTFIIQYKKCYYECKHPDSDITPSPHICVLNKKGELSIAFDDNSNMDEYRNEHVDITSAIGFTCYYTWKGIKKKIPKSFLEYTEEITTISDLFINKE